MCSSLAKIFDVDRRHLILYDHTCLRTHKFKNDLLKGTRVIIYPTQNFDWGFFVFHATHMDLAKISSDLKRKDFGN
jgi:hypothetical protein